MRDLDQALADPHFKARGIEAHGTLLADGQRLTALPVPIVPQFRAGPEQTSAAPPLGGAGDAET